MPTNRSGIELLDLVREVEQPFITGSGPNGTGIRARMRRMQEKVDSRWDYTQHISPTLREKLSINPSLLRHERNIGVAHLIAMELRIHNEPKGKLKREETAADRIEMYEMHAVQQLDPDGQISEHQAQQAIGPGFFWAGWIEMGDFSKPMRGDREEGNAYEKRLDAARSGHFPFRILEMDSETVAFMEHNRRLTLAVCRYKLPVADALSRFYKGDKSNRERRVGK